MRFSCCLILALVLACCATATKPGVVHVPVVSAQEGVWIESGGVRYQAPAIVPVSNGAADQHIVVGSPVHAPSRISLSSSFQWRSLWLGPAGVALDLATDSAFQQEDDQVAVDLEHGTWKRSVAPYVRDDEFRRGAKWSRIGKISVAGGALAAVAGNALMMSSVCYEECDPSAEKRLATGLILQSAAAAVLISGGLAWYRGARKKARAKTRFLARSVW